MIRPPPVHCGRVTPMQPLPREFTQTLLALCGPAGQAWLDDLPALLRAYEQRWSLRVGPPFASLSYHYVAPATRSDGTEVVLKAGVPNHELTTEIEALRRFDGRGAARLLEADAPAGVLLLERIRPGGRLLDRADDEQATAAAAAVMQTLWRPAPEPGLFPSVGDWGRGFERLHRTFSGGTGPFPPALVDVGERLYADLTASMGESVLLHGDLHHENILADQQRGWLAIDPKGVIGEREYEPGALLRNPFPALLTWPDAARRLERRLDQLAEALGFERQRLHAWALAQAVLSAWWAFEDGLRQLSPWLEVAQLLHAL